MLTTTTATWTLNADPSSSSDAIFCRIYTTPAESPQASNLVEKDCLHLTASGQTSNLTSVIIQNGVTTTYQETVL